MVGQGERTGDGFVGGDIYKTRNLEYVLCKATGKGIRVPECYSCDWYGGIAEMDSNCSSGKSKKVLCSYGDKEER